MPVAGHRPDHGSRIEFAAIDAHSAAEVAADIEGGLDDGVAGAAHGAPFVCVFHGLPPCFLSDYAAGAQKDTPAEHILSRRCVEISSAAAKAARHHELSPIACSVWAIITQKRGFVKNFFWKLDISRNPC
jgi:hypothetical protein